MPYCGMTLSPIYSIKAWHQLSQVQLKCVVLKKPWQHTQYKTKADWMSDFI